MTYRKDIDGLRAIAVLAVIAFHLGLPRMQGGFVGVDIFFVISGYLITGHLRSDMDLGRFAVLNFYERRLRRIAPALLVMLIVVSAVALAVLFPLDLERYAASAIAALLSVSNFYFWAHSGYFAPVAQTRPLLHTWSLGVEEQYYLLFPFVLVGVSRLVPAWRNAVLWGVALLSLGLSVLLSYVSPESGFYLLPARAWELLLGALIALDAVPAPARAVGRNVCVGGGILLLLISIVRLGPDMPWPGALALVPCVGAGLVILGGKTGPSWAARPLSFSPMVFIGLISYSLYLWHWPVLVFFRTVPSAAVRGAFEPWIVGGVSCLLGVLSWRFVEKPFRDRKRIGTGVLVRSSAIAASVTAALCVAVLAGRGFPERFPPEVVRLASFLGYDDNAYNRYGTCYVTGGYEKFARYDTDRCQKLSNRKNVALVGDSHAADLWPGLSQVAAGVNLLQVTATGCKPLLPLRGEPRCVAVMRDFYDRFAARRGLDTVLISVMWYPADLERLAATVDWWRKRGVRVVLIGPAPEYDLELPRLLAWARLRNDAALPGRHKFAGAETMDRALAEFSRTHHVDYLPLYASLCPNGRCVETAGGVPIEFDGNHFTAEGSLAVARLLKARSLID